MVAQEGKQQSDVLRNFPARGLVGLADMKLTADNYVRVLAALPRQFEFRGASATDVETWQSAFRPYLHTLLGLPRIAQRGACDLSPQQLGQEDCGDHIREEWTIQTEPGFRVPFYLLRPHTQAGTLPVVITPHGHGKAGKRTYVGIADSTAEQKSISEGERDIALQAVRAGYIAIAPDMRGFASMRREEDRQKDATSSCRTLQMHAIMFGRTLVGERVWDVMRLIDYAATRLEIDANRVVVTGNSGGGTVSLFAGACDPRISVTIPGSYFCTFEHSIGSVYHCECNYIPGLFAVAEMYDVAGLIAPRPFLAVAGRQDTIFPYEGVQLAFARLKHIYTAAGAPERCQLSLGASGHRYYQADVWPFVRQWV